MAGLPPAVENRTRRNLVIISRSPCQVRGFSSTLTTSLWLNRSAACLHYVDVKGCLKIEAKAPGYGNNVSGEYWRVT